MNYERVRDIILGHFPSDKKILSAVSYSGGPDSGVLLSIALRMYREGLIPAPDAVYFNHQLRGRESEHEEKFVMSQCSSYGIKLRVIRLDVRRHAEEKGLSVETAARELRYSAYDTLSGKYDLIMQGHHASDNAETVFFNIMRGSGLDGASGIRNVRGNVIRPLLEFTRDEILLYARENSVDYITDSSNLKSEYSRNRIRNVIFPVIEKELGRDATDRINSFSDSVREANGFIGRAAWHLEKRLVRTSAGISFIKRDGFLDTDPYLRSVILRSAFRNTGFPYSPDRQATDRILAAVAEGKANAYKEKDMSVTVYRNNIIVLNRKNFFNPAAISVKEGVHSEYYFDPARIKGDICECGADPGSLFTPFGKKNPEKLSKTFSDKKIPLSLRGGMLCLKDSEKTVFVQGCGISAEVASAAGNKSVWGIIVKNDILKKLFK